MENPSELSVLDFPPEVTIMIMKNLKLVDLLKLFSLRSEFAELRYEKSLETFMGNITLNQLCQLYSEATTENQRNQCFHKQVLDRLEIDTFNEVVHLYMRQENNEFFSNGKILESFGNQIILVEEPDMHYTSDFCGCFKKLAEKIDGEIFLIGVGNINAKQLWNGWKGFNIRRKVKYLVKVGKALPTHFPNLAFKYRTHGYGPHQYHYLKAPSLNCIDTTRKLISMMKSNVLQGARQNLESTLPLIQAKLALHEYNGLDQHEWMIVIKDLLMNVNNPGI